MGLAHSPRIVTDGLVLALDAGNGKGYDKYENLLLSSESFDSWTDSGNITVTPNAIEAPDGTLTADKIEGVDTGISTYVYQSLVGVNTSTTYTYSFWIKSVDGSSGDWGINFFNSTGHNRTTVPVTGEWNRVSAQFSNFNTSNNNIYIADNRDGLADLTEAYVWGAQLEQGSYVNDYYKTTGVRKTRGTTWTDLSGNGNNGTLIGVPSYNNTNGGNFNFDNVDDYVNLGSSVINSTAYTKVAWIRPEGGSRNIISSSGTNGHVMWMSNSTSTVYAGHNGYWSNTNFRVSHRPNNPGDMLNQWWCVVVTFSTSSGWAMYFNGELVDTDSNTDALNNASLDTYISSYGGAGANLFDGDIPVVQIYNRALTASEVKQNFNALRGRFGI